MPDSSPDPFATSEPPPDPVSVRGGNEIPALVVVWSPHDPSRLGEVLFIDSRGEDLVFGRGDEPAASGRRLFLHRQRPGVLERTPPLQTNGVSRAPLILNQLAVGLTVRRGGQPAIRVNGVEIGEYGTIAPGDTIEIDRQMLFLCVKRPVAMPALRYGRIEMSFGAPDVQGMIGESPRAWRLRDDLALAAQMPGHVLIRGESGTGKELAAAAVHRGVTRANGMLISHSAASLPAGLIDAELFGNARNFPNPGMLERPGLVGAADGGTLFLDEIGEASHELHAHLLRVLDSKGEYKRLGDERARTSTFRFVAATNRERAALKHDLLARLANEVELPSLRDRREDVPLIARAHLLETAKRSPAAARFLRGADATLDPRMTAELADTLVRFPYSTNVRQIVKLLSHAVAESARDVLTVPRRYLESEAATQAQNGQSVAPSAGDPLPSEDRVRAALAASRGNVSHAAKSLRLSRQALYRLMTKYAIATDR